VRDVAAWHRSLLTVIVQDRHNGNILLDVEGHIIHIDYGFLLGIAPGLWQFETAPFKLTGEYIELIGGFDSECYRYYEALLIKGFLQLRKYHSRFVQLIEMMVEGTFAITQPSSARTHAHAPPHTDTTCRKPDAVSVGDDVASAGGAIQAHHVQAGDRGPRQVPHSRSPRVMDHGLLRRVPAMDQRHPDLVHAKIKKKQLLTWTS
jgi:hypothetical protein